MHKRYAIGIDLGTSNSALAVAPLDPPGPPQVIPVLQQVSRHSVAEQPSLPSFLYLRTEQEQQSRPQLPWDDAQTAEHCIGAFAHDHGSLLPDRLISSAKSWLCTPAIDPQQPLLPWQSSLKEHQLSPFAAQVHYLRHLRQALLHHFASQPAPFSLEQCDVTITVPASFDEIARILTSDAAESAGWGEVTLLEEQQAAFYAWLDNSGDAWRTQVQPGDVVLVCDVGGGTADFSLIAVTDQQGNLQLERISVGDHILLGGDNMDLALAYSLKMELEQAGQRIDQWQLQALVHSCRRGKEALFSDDKLAEFSISIPSRGASLLAKTLTCTLQRRHLEHIVLDGFLPRTGIDQHPAPANRSGLQEFGLSYANDPVLSKHLAQFLVNSATNVSSSPHLTPLVADCLTSANGVRFIQPTAVLFNGGLFNAPAIRHRIFDLLQSFDGDRPLRELHGERLDLAVALGAAVYGRNRASGEGLRIKAGTARSYYIGLESAMPAIPGLVFPLKALCVVPQGMEEGSEVTLSGEEFGLVTGQPVEFRFFSSSVRAGDGVGQQVDDALTLDETSTLEITLPSEQNQPGQLVPVQLHARITELGTLELWMQHRQSQQRWKIEFNVRGH